MDVVRFAVRYFGVIRHLVHNEVEHVECPVPATVRDLLNLLGARHGEEFHDRVFDLHGGLRRDCAVVVGDETLRETAELDKRLDGDGEIAVWFLIPIEGGD